MTWTAEEMPLCILRLERRPNVLLVKQQILALTKDPETYDRPRVIGEVVVRGEATVTAAKRLGWGMIEVQKRREPRRLREYDGPPVKSVYILEEVEPLLETLRERLSEILNGDGGPAVSRARALELAIVNALQDWGFPGEATGALRDTFSIPGASPAPGQRFEAEIDPPTVHVEGDEGPQRLSEGGGRR